MLGVVTPVFLIAGRGYIWARRGLPFDNNTISTLVMFIGSPCLIYSSLTANAPALDDLFRMAAAAVFVVAAAAVLGYLILKALGWQITSFLPSLIQPNGGNMGLPICLLAFGETGLALGMAFFFVNSISQYTLGLAISSGQFQLKSLLHQPVVWAVIVTLSVLALDVQMPRWFNASTELLGGLTIPAMLLMLGTSLAGLKVAALTQPLTVSALRLGLGVLLGVAAILLFDLSGPIAGVVLLQSAMPSAVFNYVFAERFNREPDKVAGVILLSTVMSVVTLPAMVAWACR